MDREAYPFVSVVILNYNGKHHLKTCLESLLKTDYPDFEMILVDNGSTDGSVDFVRSNYPSIKIVRLRRNYGSAIGYTIGVLHGRGEYVAILNNDMEVDPNWLKSLVNYVRKFEKNGVVAADPKFRSYFHRHRFEDTAAAGRWIDYFGNNYTRGINEVDQGQYDKPVYIMGVLTLFKRDVLIKSGAFDPFYIFGYEDIDLGWRLYLMGYRAIYVPQSIIYHKSGATTRVTSRRAKPGFYYLTKRNRLITLIKHYSILNMLLSLLVTLLEYLFLITYFALARKKEYSYDIMLAIYKALFKDLRYALKKRTRIQALRKVNDTVIKKYMVPYSGIMWYRASKGDSG